MTKADEEEDVRVPTSVSMAADERSATSADDDDDDEEDDEEDGSLTGTATATGCGRCIDDSVCNWDFEAGDDADADEDADEDADAAAMRASKSDQWQR